MSDLLTLRVPGNEKEALAFSSQLSGMPVSKVIMPFLIEGTKVSLGASLLFRIGTNVYKRDRYEDFIDLLQEPTKKGTSIIAPMGPAELQNIVPRVVWDFFDLLVLTKAVSRMNEALEEVELEMDTSFISPDLLRSLCYSIGDSYLSMGGSLESMNFQLANEVFFHRMLHIFYWSNAKGTQKALSTQWYAKGDLISKIVGEMNEHYSERSGARVMEAIVVSAPARKRGRPKKKKRKALPPGPQVIAKEIPPR
jgi:hypothetical protein